MTLICTQFLLQCHLSHYCSWRSAAPETTVWRWPGGCHLWATTQWRVTSWNLMMETVANSEWEFHSAFICGFLYVTFLRICIWVCLRVGRGGGEDTGCQNIPASIVWMWKAVQMLLIKRTRAWVGSLVEVILRALTKRALRPLRRKSPTSLQELKVVHSTKQRSLWRPYSQLSIVPCFNSWDSWSRNATHFFLVFWVKMGSCTKIRDF